YSVFRSILTIGAMIRAILSGRIEDHFGRRGAMAFSELLCIVGCLAIVFAIVAWLLNVARLLNSIGIGILSYVLMICFGVSLIWIVGTIIHWRILALIGIIPSILQFLGVFFIPESPRWLAKNSRWEDREDVLKYLRGQHVDTSAEADEIREYAETFRIYLKQIFFDLFQREYTRSMIVSI
ncbi:Sugar transporter ERD6-like 5, partial [Bienertia sinuspersici]